jgi:hypothetical protein
MRRVAVVLFVLCCMGFSQRCSHAQGDETKVIALENLWNQMQLNHDADAMGKILDPDFVLTDYDGTVCPRPNSWCPSATCPTNSRLRFPKT